ncbi:MAG TPA: metallophosphoesterase family protein [Chitinophagaceae bacterium]|nr:metallophosphoesterase family protein [Chitinophagaceae bacterium]
MRIGIISDIHANLPAIEEVLKALHRQGVTKIYCLGDTVNQNVWNNEVIELLLEKNIPVIQGNHDAGIGKGLQRFPFSFSSRETEKIGFEAIRYTLQQVTDENKKVLLSYPEKKQLTYHYADGKTLSMLLAHGVPGNMNERLYRFLPKKYFEKIIRDTGADVLLTGNTHSPHHLIIPFQTKEGVVYKHAINPGAVGKAGDGDWRASYAIITLEQNKDLLAHPEALQVDFYRLTYDIDKAVKAIQHSPLNIMYAGFLLGG